MALLLRVVPHNAISHTILCSSALTHLNVRFFTIKTTRNLDPLPVGLTGYLNTNHQDIVPSLLTSVRGWLGLPPTHTKTSHTSSSSHEGESEEGENFEQEGDYDIRLSEADTLQGIEDDLKRTQLFGAIDELRQTVRLNHITPFNPKWEDTKQEVHEFVVTFNNLVEKRRLLSAISAAELAMKLLPQYKHHTLQSRALALVELAHGSKSGLVSEQKLFSLKRDELLRTAATDMEMALAAEPSAEIANQYLNLSTLVASFGDFYSLSLARQMVSFLIAKTAKEMKETHMRLSNLYALFSCHLVHHHVSEGHYKFRHAYLDTYVRSIVLDIIKSLTNSLQEHTQFPLKPIQELNVLGMLDFRSKLWAALDEKHRAIDDLNLALEAGTSDERLLRRANIYHDLKNYVRAIEDVTKVAEKNPLEFDLNWLANLYELNGQTEKMLILWRFILVYSPTISAGTDGLLYSRLAGVANHARLHTLAQFAATEGLTIETAKVDVSYDLICDLYGRRGAAYYNAGNTDAAMADIVQGLQWYTMAVRNNTVTESVKKAAAELYLLRGSINIYAGNMHKAFEDFDMSVKLVPSMIQRVKEFQDSITVSKSTRYIYIDRNQILYAVVACFGVYIGIVLLRN
eukprot:Phypoly_transcript_05064.p1 GENE.Phypoly_transcript_05064~~Phypoly_transcript_05064.p1  ORF type:complete len:628 (+),score=78.13 Phypoly_transcript_05064:150-2033(+)